MTTGSPDSDENTVSADTTLPEKTSTDSLPALPSRKKSAGAADPGNNGGASKSFLDDEGPVLQRLRIGWLMMTIDNPEFAYGVQRGMEFASLDCEWMDYDGTSAITMQEMHDKMRHQLEEAQITGSTDALGVLFGEICYMLLGTTRMQVQFGRRSRVVLK
jgi:hypothetical protein